MIPNSPDSSSFSFKPVLYFTLRWTPRAVIAGFAGYYSLGIAYDKGVMAAIDRLAIDYFRKTMGYAAMGALMPTFQWYSAWSIRIISALTASILYDLAERIVLATFKALKNQIYGENPLTPAPKARIFSTASQCRT